MSLKIVRFVLGPLETNVYLITDSVSRQTVVIDPTFGSKEIIRYLGENSLELTSIWITHAHFDHYAGAGEIIRSTPSPVQIALHPEDLPLWEKGGEAAQFGIQVDLSVQPTLLLAHNQTLMLGEHPFQVLHTPGHSPGHVTFFASQLPAAFCGDVIFHRSIGRTDLTGGNHDALIHSIRTQILTMPPHTKLYSGHGKETTVEEEGRLNPFLI